MTAFLTHKSGYKKSCVFQLNFIMYQQIIHAPISLVMEKKIQFFCLETVYSLCFLLMSEKQHDTWNFRLEYQLCGDWRQDVIKWFYSNFVVSFVS